jgi:Initiator Replication protein
VVRQAGDRGRLAVRRNELVLGHFRLSVWAQRLFLLLVAHVEDDTDDRTAFRFDIADLARRVGVDRSRLYTDLVDTIYELERTKVFVDRIDGKPGKMYVGLVQNKQGFGVTEMGKQLRVTDGKVAFYFHEEILPYVKELSTRFSKVELEYALRLRSSFSQKLYDILKAHQWHGGEYRLSMAELRAMLALGEGEYAKFGDFRRLWQARLRPASWRARCPIRSPSTAPLGRRRWRSPAASKPASNPAAAALAASGSASSPAPRPPRSAPSSMVASRVTPRSRPTA